MGGIRFQADVDRDATGKQSSGRTADRIVIAILSVAVLFFALDKFLGLPASNSPPAELATIAVLPFDDLSAGNDQAWFADGLADELLNLLAHNPSLKVAARTSSFSFRDAELPISEIADRLQVQHVLEGSVRRNGDLVRITAQLISADDGYHVWSETFEEPLADIFFVQDEISSQIARALEVAVLDNKPPVFEIRPADYALYLQANHVAMQGNVDALLDAVNMYLEVLNGSPEYPDAWANLSSIYANLVARGELEPNYGYTQARDAAIEAIRIDPSNSHGHDQLAWISFWHDADIQAAVASTQTALDIAPHDSDVAGHAAVILAALGDIDESIRLHEFSVSRSPVDSTAHRNLGLAYKYADRLTEAEQSFRRTLQLSPQYDGASYQLGETIFLLGRPQEALEIWSVETDEAYRLKGLALANFELGNLGAADEALAELIESWGNQWPSEVAHVYSWRGELDLAFEWLEIELDKYGPAGWGEWKLQRLYDNLRQDPRWAAFLQRVGASQDQLDRYQLSVPQIQN